MRPSSSGCIRGEQFVIDFSSRKKKGTKEERREDRREVGKREEKMVSKKS